MSIQKQGRFLAALMEGWSPTRAAQVAGIPRQTVFDFKERSAPFSAAWDAAVEAGSDKLEDAARARSLEGWEEPVFYKGRRVGRVRKYSDTLLMFQLNGRRPTKYRQHVKLDAPDLAVMFRAAMAKASQPAALQFRPSGNGAEALGRQPGAE